MKTILFLTDLHVGAHIAEIEGVYERARTYRWHVVEVEYEHSSRPIADYVRTWKPDGCIFCCAALTEPLAPRTFRDIPTIYLDPDERTRKERHHCVINDPQPLAQMAFRELTSLKCASYAFVGWNQRTTWSEGRRLAFEKLMNEAGLPVKSFTDPWTAKDRMKLHRQLSKWIAPLPKPCGIFAANDDTASQVAEACNFAGLEIPKDVAVLGVDNLELICENAVTSLSSIEIDFREAGRICADQLADLMEHPKKAPSVLSFGPGRIVHRQSTRNLALNDIRVTRALERIRREACFGLSAADVIADMALPRRVAERKFRQATGKTILAEITEKRMERVFMFLRDPDYPINLIAQQCGWQTDVFLKRLFKRTTGLTMRDWRKRELTARGSTPPRRR